MGLLSLNLPVIGQSSATEDQKVRDALAAIQTDYNGNLTDANIAAAAGIQESKLANGTAGMARGSFHAFRSASVVVATGGVVIFDDDSTAPDAWDVSGWYDTATGRYTPQVAGYYCFSWAVKLGSVAAADVLWQASLRKNGTTMVGAGQEAFQRGATTPANSVGSGHAFANGTTDFFEIVMTHSVGAATTLTRTVADTFFAGHLIGRS
jgi:hypothetical protein